MRSYGIDKLKKILAKLLPRTKAHQIWIKTDNMNIDILGNILLHFPCAVEVDEDDIPEYSDFKRKVTALYELHKDGLLANY